MKFYKKQLESGLTVVLLPKNNSPIVTVNMSYKVGSKDEQKGRTGLAHLFEHLMFEGTPNVPRGKFDEICSNAGGTNNAYTTYDWTTYYMTLPISHLELGLWLEADRLYNYKLDQKVLDVQKKVVTEEIYQTVIDQPYAQWREYLAKNAFKDDSSYSWEVQGKIKDVSKVDINDANTFRNKFYKPSNAVLTISGGIDKDYTFNLVEKYFSKNNNSSLEIERNKFTPDMRVISKNVSFKDKVPHPATFVSFHCDGFADNNEEYPAKLYCDIMARGDSSKLYNSLVYEQEIASHAGVFFDKRENSSLITFYALAAENKINIDELYKALLTQIDIIKDKGFTENDLKKSKNYVKRKVNNSLLKTSSIAELVSKFEMFENNPQNAFEILNQYDKIELDDITDFVNKRINTEESIRINVLVGSE